MKAIFGAMITLDCDGGWWREIHIDGHTAAALVVWRMEGAEKSPECELRAHEIVHRLNAAFVASPTELLGLIKLGAQLHSELTGFPNRAEQIAQMPQALAAVKQLLNPTATVAPPEAATDQTQVPSS